MAVLLVQALHLEDRAPESFAPEAPLFGDHADGWGLDSIDALEIALAIQQQYGVELKADSEETKQAFASLRTLTAFVETRRSPAVH